VLIGTSLEDESDQVVRSALAVARAAGARVHLVHAVALEPLVVGFEAGLGPDLIREQIARNEEKLQQQIERLGISESELAGAMVQTGAPHRILVEAARTCRADLIVVGATGSGPFAAELLGSTADRVLHKAPCPVLVVRGELQIPPRRVLAPVDLSTLSGDAFHCGLYLLSQLAKDAPTEVRVVFALSFLDSLVLQRQAPGAASREQVERHCAEKLRCFVLENRPEGPFKLDTAVVAGEARFEILDELSKHPVDLVVLGTHGRGGLDRLVLGSVAATVARKAPCSVLLISPGAAVADGEAEAVLARTTPAGQEEPAHSEPAAVG
jgi:nucleotide-binding universal stress UspA family protein